MHAAHAPDPQAQHPSPVPRGATSPEQGGGHPMAGMDDREPLLMMTQHHAMTRWADWVLLGLGAWLLASPATLGYQTPALIWSDVASGLVVIALATLALWHGWAVAAWAAALPGVWLVLAPIVFWAREPAAYANDTLVGALLVAFAVLIPHGMDYGEPAQPTRPVDTARPAAAWWGVTYLWTLLAAALLGAWLLLAPALLGSEGTPLGTSDRLAGSLAITWALIALAEVARPLRYLNVPIGLWLVAAPFVLGAGLGPAAWSGIVAGLLLVGLSLPRGTVHERYGGFSKYVV